MTDPAWMQKWITAHMDVARKMGKARTQISLPVDGSSGAAALGTAAAACWVR